MRVKLIYVDVISWDCNDVWYIVDSTRVICEEILIDVMMHCPFQKKKKLMFSDRSLENGAHTSLMKI